MRQRDQQKTGEIRDIPEELERQIRMRELVMVENERRKREEEERKIKERNDKREKEVDKQLKKRRKKPVSALLTTPFNIIEGKNLKCQRCGREISVKAGENLIQRRVKPTDSVKFKRRVLCDKCAKQVGLK